MSGFWITASERRARAQTLFKNIVENGDPVGLQNALREAELAGVDLSLSQGNCGQARSLIERALAMAALAAAIGNNEIGTLSIALETAKAIGLHGPIVENGRARLQQLNGAQEKEKAEQVLAEAIHCGDIPMLGCAIKRAAAARLDQQTLKSARRTLTKLVSIAQATRRLAAATDGSDIASLESAVTFAQHVGVPEASLARASSRLDFLRVWKRTTKLQVDLQATALQGDSVGLQAALVAAEAAGVADHIRQQYAVVLEGLQACECATRSLNAALANADIEALTAALARATDSGVDKEQLGKGRAQLQLLQSAALHDRAVQALAAARDADDSSVLLAAIVEAEIAGVDRSNIISAKVLWSQLKGKQEATALLLDALRHDDVVALTSALAEAVEARVEKATLAVARSRLDSLHAWQSNDPVHVAPARGAGQALSVFVPIGQVGVTGTSSAPEGEAFLRDTAANCHGGPTARAFNLAPLPNENIDKGSCQNTSSINCDRGGCRRTWLE